MRKHKREWSEIPRFKESTSPAFLFKPTPIMLHPQQAIHRLSLLAGPDDSEDPLHLPESFKNNQFEGVTRSGSISANAYWLNASKLIDVSAITELKRSLWNDRISEYWTNDLF